MRKNWCQSCVMALVLLGTLVPWLAPAASAVESPVIRVAYPIQAGITDKDNRGEYTGYTYEFLEEVAQYTGWNYEYVEVPGEDISEQIMTLMDMLEAGEIDLMGSMLYNDSMAELYNYTSYHYGMVETVLQVPEQVRDNFVVNSQVWQSIRVAAVNPEGQYARELMDYCSINRFELTFVPCATEAEQVEVVLEGRADALLNTSMNYMTGVRTVAAFASKPIYFVSRKDWDTNLMNQFNQAIRSVTQSNPSFTTELMDKYFPAVGSTSLELTQVERDYIEALDTLRVGVLEEWPPYQWRDEAGESRGIAVDVLRKVAELTGLKLEWVPVEEDSYLFELAAGGEVDLVTGVPYSYELAKLYNFSLLRPFVSSGYSTVTTDGSGITEGKRVALTPDSPYLKATGGEEVQYKTAVQCIQAVVDGDVDCAVVDSYTAQYYRNQPGYTRLRVVPKSGETRQVTFGLIYPRDPQLISILNRAILSLDEDTLQGFVTQNLAASQTITVTQFVEENPFSVVTAVLILAILAIVMILVVQHQRSKANRRLAFEMEKHRQVYALVNDVFFEYDYRIGGLSFAFPEGQVRQLQSLLAYDETDPTAAEKRTRREFVQWLRAQRDGVAEVQMICVDGQSHWIRLAMETVRDGERPVYSIGKVTLIDDERREKDSLLALAQRDSLTQVFNAATIRERVVECLDQGGALIILDVDSFKSINDTLGHLEGDRVLIDITRSVSQSIREDDLVGRPGGDEFLVYLVGIGSKDALARRCERILEQIREMRRQDGLPITVSMGAALSQPGERYDSLYQRADKALYQAKAEGRNRFLIAE